MERRRLHEVNTMTKRALQALLELPKPNEPKGRIELDQDVHVAIGSRFVARHRPEQR